MPPRLILKPRSLSLRPGTYICAQCRAASLATATTPAAPIESQPTAAAPAPPIARYPRTQPPSHKPPEFRKSQLHRQYQSLLRSTPLMLIFQHNNLKANEWMAIRRELGAALGKVDGEAGAVGAATKFSVVQTGMFASALRVVEFWNPDFQSSSPESAATLHPTDPSVASSAPITDAAGSAAEEVFKHGLSTQAYLAANKKNKKLRHGLEPLLSGPLAVLTFPSVSPQHLSAALSIVSPTPVFPAPKRKANPAYHEPAVQNGLQKLILLGARVEGKVFDVEGARWVGGIEGGLEGLRGQLVAMLGGVGGGITRTLEAASRSLYLTVEGRRGMLEEEGQKEGGDGGDKP